MKLQQDKKLRMNIVLSDSTTVKIHRHGGGLKGRSKVGAEVEGMLTGGNVADISVYPWKKKPKTTHHLR